MYCSAAPSVVEYPASGLLALAGFCLHSLCTAELLADTMFSDWYRGVACAGHASPVPEFTASSTCTGGMAPRALSQAAASGVAAAAVGHPSMVAPTPPASLRIRPMGAMAALGGPTSWDRVAPSVVWFHTALPTYVGSSWPLAASLLGRCVSGALGSLSLGQVPGLFACIAGAALLSAAAASQRRLAHLVRQPPFGRAAAWQQNGSSLSKEPCCMLSA
jgi:hypothetical protein